MFDLRLLGGTVRVDGKDADDWPDPDDWIHTAHSINRPVPQDGQWHSLNVPTVRWGGECRLEIDVNAHVNSDKTVWIHGWSYFYEGASEDTGEEEDRQEIDFVVPRNSSTYLLPYEQWYELRNEVLIGPEDFARVGFSLTNNITE
ncbi:hypothetical protein ACWDOP_00930 [Nocardia sp. NPDC003693]